MKGRVPGPSIQGQPRLGFLPTLVFRPAPGLLLSPLAHLLLNNCTA